MEKCILEKIKYINYSLKKFIPKDDSIISQSMRYSVLSKGKRLRPLLVILSAELFGGKMHDVIPAACAIEYIHVYSLIHDDLPAMDNDDFRRGILTNHKKFGESVAILSGDALLTEAFSLILKSKSSEKNINKAIKFISEYIGYSWMISGQIDDIKIIKNNNLSINNDFIFLKKKIKSIYIKKTSSLIIASLLTGSTLVGVNDNELQILKKYGINIGIAFQIVDDILDSHDYCDNKFKYCVEKEKKKLTALTLYTEDEAKKNVYKYIKRAEKIISIFGIKSKIFYEISKLITSRLN
ncbi:MAG: polyprenyl synthetase family protein [Endomicrobium sp.]|nr:polyprenyl synthetase family protein [Endomicrobium sp.]